MGYHHENRDKYWLERVGTREMVGYGFNGTPCYVDRYEFPFPAIRYKETTPEIQSLYEKQKGDWRLLTKEEKKLLYRANFCQTFSEVEKGTGEWMEVIGHGLLLCSVAIWMYLFLRLCVYDPLPITFSPSRKRAQLRRQIDLQVNPITGLASEWNYETNNWKKQTWRTPPNPFVMCDED
ncbi:cytochrome c oxidase subunit 4 isoform 1, mitochondrial-like isoform X2 [Sitophilus oryzae]|nr:cytochrome c oxidase subunit 4 isoform 1, mitochondrial-like isoform X2 [Sitophilus oryzae]XP_030756909.1 cytochrome c oxidase subunit 4 isoform 1, mitochondrial-like isoform X2 [Sitophilus oryzae]